MLPSESSRVPERRRDPRHRVTGHVSLLSTRVASDPLYATVVDVSAGGVRARLEPGVKVFAGEPYLVDLDVGVPGIAVVGPSVRLRGRGLSLRSMPLPDGRGLEVAIRFEGPLLVCDGFVPPSPLEAPLRLSPAPVPPGALPRS